MAWSDARTQLVSTLRAVSLSDYDRAIRGPLQHAPEAEETQASRTFHLRVTDVSTWGPTATLYQELVSAALHVDYLADGDDVEAIEEAILADRTAIVAALVDETNWGRPTSTIVTIDGGPTPIFLSTIEPLGEARLRLTIALNVIVRTT